MPAKLVPATPSVVAWAIRESGFSVKALANMLHVSEGEIEGWIRGQRPEVSKLKALAAAVNRPFSAFLLPNPPESPVPEVEFRSLSSTRSRGLNPEERLRIREAARLQGVLSWISRELEIPAPNVPRSSIKRDPEDVAEDIRNRLGLSPDRQFSWSSSSEAFRAWREAVEALGVTVLALPMGEESCRGFSMWNDRAPLSAINTAWIPEARIFTLFHELAHLVTRTNSACAEDSPPERSTAGDRVERWCERVAAAVVIPSDALAAALSDFPAGSARRITDLSAVSRIASRFRVSRRAAALRLIECERASWSLFKSIPAQGDQNRSGGGGPGRTRAEIRRQAYGQRTMALFRDGLRRDVLGAADVVDYLDVSADAVKSEARLQASHEDD